jgi:hypothetical protein
MIHPESRPAQKLPSLLVLERGRKISSNHMPPLREQLPDDVGPREAECSRDNIDVCVHEPLSLAGLSPRKTDRRMQEVISAACRPTGTGPKRSRRRCRWYRSNAIQARQGLPSPPGLNSGRSLNRIRGPCSQPSASRAEHRTAHASLCPGLTCGSSTARPTMPPLKPGDMLVEGPFRQTTSPSRDRPEQANVRRRATPRARQEAQDSETNGH